MKFGSVPVTDAMGATAVHSIRQGEFVLKKGTRIGPNEIAALKAVGIKEITVARLDGGDVAEDQAAADEEEGEDLEEVAAHVSVRSSACRGGAP